MDSDEGPVTSTSIGFGSLRVRTAIGSSIRTASIFPDSARSSYELMIKLAVRTGEGLDAGDIATVTMELIDSLTISNEPSSARDQRHERMLCRQPATGTSEAFVVAAAVSDGSARCELPASPVSDGITCAGLIGCLI